MKLYEKIKYLATTILIISLVFGQFSLLTIEANEGYQNNTGSYNCYAYAINRITINGKFYYYDSNNPTYQPGDISKDYRNVVFTPPYTIDKIKCNTLRDLYAMGHTDVMVYNIIRNVNVYNAMLASIDFSTKELICFRVGSSDYHFMRYDSATNAWYHKNGYAPIYKYTDNNGIPSNDVNWVSDNNVYDSEIIYLVYNKLQINIPENGELEQNITVKGGVDEGLNYNPIYCCGGVACCNPDGVCSCENEIVYGGKDVVYELIMPELCDYSIRLTSNDANFNYQLYSYNMYNGDYVLYSSGTSNQNGSLYEVNLISSLSAGKYYLRLDFGRNSYSDKTVSLVANSTPHLYTDDYDPYSTTQHKAYCWCGAYELQNHSLGDGLCILCGAPHIHDYSDRYVPKTNSTHISYCGCGSTSIQPHVVSAGAFSGGNKYAICLACGGTATTGVVLHQAVWNLPRSENGSFILPDGIIVLVDEDIEAYFDGTLVFYNPNDNLETE